MALVAPRILNEPIGCRFSSLSQISHGASSTGSRTSGVADRRAGDRLSRAPRSRRAGSKLDRRPAPGSRARRTTNSAAAQVLDGDAERLEHRQLVLALAPGRVPASTSPSSALMWSPIAPRARDDVVARLVLGTTRAGRRRTIACATVSSSSSRGGKHDRRRSRARRLRASARGDDRLRRAGRRARRRPRRRAAVVDVRATPIAPTSAASSSAWLARAARDPHSVVDIRAHRLDVGARLCACAEDRPDSRASSRARRARRDRGDGGRADRRDRRARSSSRASARLAVVQGHRPWCVSSPFAGLSGTTATVFSA